MSARPLTFEERHRAAQTATEPRPGRHRRAGLTVKQAELLATLIALGDGLAARDFEAALARSADRTGIVGWSASDCTVALRRLEDRGLVTRLRRGTDPGRRVLRWALSADGERAYRAWRGD